ncbi:transporter [Alkanindiges sp. WGS2144]|uniref:transporter n=1 Tax=Alkanindiges sp. WGS2144 TaxID=3366808 RepID=UPI0037531DB0
MQKQWMNRSILALSISLAMIGANVHAADAEDSQVNESADSEITTTQEQEGTTDPVAAESREQVEAPLTHDNNPDEVESTVVNTVAERPDDTQEPVATAQSAATASGSTAVTPSMAPKDSAASVLEQKADDASAQSNLEEVFTRSEQQYSLSKRGSYSAYYDVDYSYYRDSRLDLALSDSGSALTRLRVEEDAQHSITNTFTFQYGLLDNVTLTASLPLVAKSDNLKDATTAGLGDISLGARWEPFPLKQGRLPLILFGSLSTKTGDSPYEIDPVRGLSTGKGYYSIGGGASTRKFIDPVVLFASGSVSYGLKETGINQVRGNTNRILESFDPGMSGGISFGFAYSFNYDVSLTMSYQQSFSTGSEFKFDNGDVSKPADQTSASLGFSLGVRVTPKTIVNGSVGFGLTEDAPDVSLGLSFPLDFLGFGRDNR